MKDHRVHAAFATAENVDAEAMKSDVAVMLYTRSEIERGHVGDAVDRLMAFSDRRDLTARYIHAMSFVVQGYDDDSRELSEIPEVRRWFRDITAQWPYWLVFLDPSQHDLLATLLDDVFRVFRASGQYAVMFSDHAAAERTQQRLQRAAATLLATYGLV